MLNLNSVHKQSLIIAFTTGPASVMLQLQATAPEVNGRVARNGHISAIPFQAVERNLLKPALCEQVHLLPLPA